MIKLASAVVEMIHGPGGTVVACRCVGGNSEAGRR